MALKYPAERILIRCPNWIGDMVAATAAIRCIRRNYPQAHLALLVSPYVQPVIANAPWPNELIPFDSKAGLAGILRVGKKLRQRPRYDLALLLTHSFSSALAIRLGRVRRRVGHGREGRSWLLTDAVPWPERKAEGAVRVGKVDLYADLLRYLGCEGADDKRPELFTSEEDEAVASRMLKEHGFDPARRIVALVPGAAYGSAKLWPAERFAAVADRLYADGMQPVILTGPGETAIAQQISIGMKGQSIWFREGDCPFGVSKALIRRAALMICNDTGPRHVAIAFNVPTVVLMGPTDPAITASDYARTIILRQDVPCGPCQLRVCPTDHRCMLAITPDMVLGAAKELLLSQ